MPGTVQLISLSLAALSIVLGFVALLMQKTYINADTQKPVDIEIPLLGKMKSNYPALVFVFLGFSLAFFVLQKEFTPKEKKELSWEIAGTFADPAINDWQTGELRLVPAKIEQRVTPNGRFLIRMNIEEGKSFEDLIDKIEYTHRDGQITIYPRDEYAAYTKGSSCKLEKAISCLRTYRSIPLQRTPAN